MNRGWRLGIAGLITAAALVAGACDRPGQWDASGASTTSIVPSPFPQNYSWALMTFDGALAGEGSVQEPQREISSVRGRYTDTGILIEFGHGESKFHLELRPLEGTGRYFVDANRGYFRLELPAGSWESSGQAVCSFNFWRVTGTEVPFSPPLGGEVFEVDLGFVCAALAGVGGGAALTIVDGRIHTFLLRPPVEAVEGAQSAPDKY